MVDIQVNGGTATCNSSPERCGHAVIPFCIGIKKDGQGLSVNEYYNLPINEGNFPQCGMIFPADIQVTPSAKSPTTLPTS